MTAPRLAHKVVKPAPYFSDADHGTDVAKTIERARSTQRDERIRRGLPAEPRVVHVGRVAFGQLVQA